jgi:hypothetical protein
MSKTQQEEIDALRKQMRIQQHQLEAAEKEVTALRSGKPEARSIAESAEVLAAERDQWRERFNELAAFNADLDTLLRHYESNTAPQADLLGRIHKQRSGVRVAS